MSHRKILISLVAVATLYGCTPAVVPEPEPQRIAFIARDAVRKTHALYAANIDGSELELLTALPTPSTNRFAITDDGRYVFITGKSGSELPLIRIETTTGAILPLGDISALYATPSPDGTRLAWFEHSLGRKELVVSGSNGLGRMVLADSSVRLSISAPPAWSPDGSMIVVSVVTSATGEPAQNAPYVINVASGKGTPCNTSVAALAPVWLASDTLAFIASAGRSTFVYTYAISSGVTQRLLTEPLPEVNSMQLTVSPNMQTLVAMNPLLIIDRHSGTVKSIRTEDAIVYRLSWSKDSKSFIYGDRTASALYSAKLFHVTASGESQTLPSWDTLGSIQSAVWLR